MTLACSSNDTALITVMQKDDVIWSDLIDTHNYI
jgi:hypothetical protein